LISTPVNALIIHELLLYYTCYGNAPELSRLTAMGIRRFFDG
jgi:hypothetical protein